MKQPYLTQCSTDHTEHVLNGPHMCLWLARVAVCQSWLGLGSWSYVRLTCNVEGHHERHATCPGDALLAIWLPLCRST